MSKREFKAFVGETLKIAEGPKNTAARREAIRLLAAMVLAQEYALR